MLERNGRLLFIYINAVCKNTHCLGKLHSPRGRIWKQCDRELFRAPAKYSYHSCSNTAVRHAGDTAWLPLAKFKFYQIDMILVVFGLLHG